MKRPSKTEHTTVEKMIDRNIEALISNLLYYRNLERINDYDREFLQSLESLLKTAQCLLKRNEETLTDD